MPVALQDSATSSFTANVSFTFIGSGFRIFTNESQSVNARTIVEVDGVSNSVISAQTGFTALYNATFPGPAGTHIVVVRKYPPRLINDLLCIVGVEVTDIEAALNTTAFPGLSQSPSSATTLPSQTTQPDASAVRDSGHNLSAGVIAAIAICGALLAALGLCIVVALRRRRRRSVEFKPFVDLVHITEDGKAPLMPNMIKAEHSGGPPSQLTPLKMPHSGEPVPKHAK